MDGTQTIARAELRQFIERIERLEEEKAAIGSDIKDVMGEAKGRGYDTKAIRTIIRLRKKDANERAEEEAILDTYMAALGMIPQIEMFDPKEVKPVSREERRRQLMSEDMADHKSLVDQMADAGLISEEARHENKALADAVATKFGNGPAQALQSPRKAAEAVSETNPRLIKQVVDGMQTEAGRAVLIAAVDIMIEREEAEDNSPETANLSGADTDPGETAAEGICEAVTVVGTESGTVSNSKTDAAISRPEITPDRPEIENRSDEEASVSNASGEMQDECAIHLPTRSDGGLNIVHKHTGIATASHGEAEAPSAASEITQVSGGANTGGDHVADYQSFAAQAGASVQGAPAIKPLRPLCKRPDSCGGYGTTHCWTCLRASKETTEEAAA